MPWVKRCRVWVSCFDDFHGADDAGWFAIGVVKKCKITDAHIVANHVADLVITNAGPGFDMITLEIVDAVCFRFAFHEPMLHVIPLFSPSPASGRGEGFY